MQDWERWVPRYRLGKVASFADMPPSHQSPGAPFLFWQYTDDWTGRRHRRRCRPLGRQFRQRAGPARVVRASGAWSDRSRGHEKPAGLTWTALL